MERATARLAQVRRLRQELPIAPSIMKAVDGASMTGPQQAHYKRHLLRPSYPFPLRPAEVATFLSHRACWQAIVNQGLDAALILEDDVALEEPAFSRALEAAQALMVQGDMVRFPIKMREKPGKILSAGVDPCVMVPRSIGLGMVVQIVTRDAARVLLEKTRHFDRPVDTYLQMRWDHGLRVLTVWPSGVREISADLGGSLIGKRRGLWDRIRREILRPLYRLQLSLYQRVKGGKR
ncbi:glycosyltransferase family 25 protein [Pontitalea aquivivens]|uniref:glycosyltransferase family 25 protein n=1 Tax=Pontitalea aquivivens TaxID=3388663 RepID=UPI003970DD4E